MIPARPPCASAVQLHKQVGAWKAEKRSEREVVEAKTMRGKDYRAQGQACRLRFGGTCLFGADTAAFKARRLLQLYVTPKHFGALAASSNICLVLLL